MYKIARSRRLHTSCCALLAASVIFFGGCGYVGPVVPPSPQIPGSITDLNVVQTGDQLVIQFSTPARTSDDLAIRQFSAIDLRAGLDVQPFSTSVWAGSARNYPIPSPEANDRDIARSVPIEWKIPVSDWEGKTIAVAVRTAIKKGDHFGPWSNVVRLPVIPPLAVPHITAEPTAKGYRLSWTSVGADVDYAIHRSGPLETTSSLVGIVKGSEYLDETTQWDTPYTYQVNAQKGAASSPLSDPVKVKSPDIYPPSVPSGLTALPINGIVELSWQRSPDVDTAGYYLYRSVDNTAPTRIPSLLPIPTYRDTTIQPGKRYSYQATAVDRKGNESAKSEAVDITP